MNWKSILDLIKSLVPGAPAWLLAILEAVINAFMKKKVDLSGHPEADVVTVLLEAKGKVKRRQVLRRLALERLYDNLPAVVERRAAGDKKAKLDPAVLEEFKALARAGEDE